MPQPSNRYDLLRQKKNNFKRQSFYVQANSVFGDRVIPPSPAPSPDSDTLGTEDYNNVGTESLDYIAVS
jgi:hypothetical protein